MHLSCFSTQNTSTIVSKMATFKCSSFASSAVSNLPQKNRTMVQLTASVITQWGQILPRGVVFYSIEWCMSNLYSCAKVIC